MATRKRPIHSNLRQVFSPKQSQYISFTTNLRYKYGSFFSAFAKFRKTTICFAMSVRLSNRPFVRMEQLSSHWTNFMIFDI